MHAAAEAVQTLNATLKRPLRPTFDQAGRLIGATRDGEAVPESKLEQLERRIAQLEARTRV